MSLTLSSVEVEQLTRAVELLVTPLDHADSNQWRASVNRHLKELLRADSAGFMLPARDGALFYSDEHDPRELAKYPDLSPPPLADGTPCYAASARKGVARVRDLYGEEFHRYLRSDYYNEYAAPNRAHDTLGLMLGGEDVPLHQWVSLQFWHERPRGRRFGEREVQLLRVLEPAIKAGADTIMRWAGTRAELMRSIDLLGEAVLVADASGRVLHQTPAFNALIEAEAEHQLLYHAVLEAARAAGAVSRGGGDVASAQSLARDIRTGGGGSYRVLASLHTHTGAGIVLVAVKSRIGWQPTDAELRERFGLTAAEVRVARLLAEGRSNAQMAVALCNSPHTVRHHTERILMKLGVRSRAEVTRLLLAG